MRLSKEAIFYSLLLGSPNNCLFYFNEQVPVDRNMLVFFLLFINDK